MTSTIEKQKDDEERVHFRFEGDSNQGIAPVSIELRRKELRAFPESLLTKLSEDTWRSRQNENAGCDAGNPLITKPLEAAPTAKFEWSTSLAKMIKQAYKRKLAEDNDEKKRPIVDLPEDVEMHDALMALDYYGTCLDPELFNLRLQSVGGHVRAQLFLKESRGMRKATTFILEKLKNNPHRETLFIFLGKDVDYVFVNKNRSNTHESRDFVRVGVYNDCQEHAEWVQDYHLRIMLISKLEAQDLEAEFVQQDFCNSKNAAAIYGGNNDATDECVYSCILAKHGEIKAPVLKITVPRGKKRPRHSY